MYVDQFYFNFIIMAASQAQPNYPHLNPTVYHAMPTFVVAEFLFFTIAILAFAHAWTRNASHPAGRRRHVLMYLFAVVGGCCNDLLFMTMPLTDNFWHSQATIMLTPRLPLYILAVYASFLYVPVACVWRLGLPPLAESTLAGIAAMFFYAPFDVVGIKFLWWTWHDSDTVVAERIMNVPVSSTMWVGVYTCMFAFLFNVLLHPSHQAPVKNLPHPTNNISLCSLSSVVRACLASFLSVPLMMLHMMVVQCLLGGLTLPPPPPPTRIMLGFTMVSYGCLTLSSLADAAVDPRGQVEKLKRDQLRIAGTAGRTSQLLLVIVLLYYSVLMGVAWFGDPTSHVSTGIHQTFGPCGVESIDYAGEKCDKFVCDVLRVQDSYSMNCGGSGGGGTATALIKPKQGIELEWYSICGLPKHDAWTRISMAYSASGLFVFLLIIGVQGYAGTKNSNKIV
jgi:hypothetical protein